MYLFGTFSAATATEDTPTAFLALQICRMNVGLEVFDRSFDAVREALKNSDLVRLLDILLSRVNRFRRSDRQFVARVGDVPGPLSVGSH